MSGVGKDFYTVHHGDARYLGQLLKSFSNPKSPGLTCTITSPPYASLKDYGHPDQIGWRQPYADYRVEMRRVFRAIYEHTKTDGSMWVIADTLRAEERNGNGLPQPLEPLPFHLAEEAGDSGWILREVAVWQKDKTLPWSSGDRFRNSFEYILLFVKSSHYKFYIDRLRDPAQLESWWVKWPERYNPHGKVPTNVWRVPIPVQGSWKSPAVQHVCPLPPDLVERLLYLSTDEGDVVFDPFAGTGVVVAEAERLSRRGLGIELNDKYVRAFQKAVRPAVLARNKRDPVTESMNLARERRTAIFRLRSLKYPKVMIQKLTHSKESLPAVRFVVSLLSPPKDDALLDPEKLLDVRCIFAVEGKEEEMERMRRFLKEIASRPPLTKFGIAGDIVVCKPRDVARLIDRKTLYIYTEGRTWDASGRIKLAELKTLKGAAPVRKGTYPYPPILSNVAVHEDPTR